MRKKTFIGVLITLVVAGLLFALIFRSAGVDKWEAMTNRVERLKLETRSRNLPRSVLRGKLSPGNAWDEYNIALLDSQAWMNDQNGALFARFVNGDRGVDRAAVEQLVASHAKAIEHLRLGAQRSDGQYPYNWERGNQMEIPSLLGSRRLANVSVAQARIWAEKGRPQDAADLLLDVSVFARDLSTNGALLSSLIGFALYSITFDEMRHLVLSGKLTQKQLVDLAKKLETVDRDFPTLSPTLSNESLLFGITAVEGHAGLAPKEWWQLVKNGDLRYAMTPKTTMLEAFETREAHLQRFQKLDGTNYAVAIAEANSISAETDASLNAIVRMSMPSLARTVVAYRETLARLRLLRTGTIFLGTGKMPTLADPFGDDIFHKRESGETRIWSIGRNGRNDNSSGNWEEGQPDILFKISN